MAGSLTTQRNTVALGDKAEVINTLKALVGNCYDMAGYSFGSVEEDAERFLDDFVSILYSQLVKYFPNTTFAEIEKAFTDGALGFYGENRGMPVARFIDYLRKYNESRQGVNLPQKEDAEPKALPRSKRADSINLLQCLYENWKNGKQDFNCFDSRKMLNFLLAEGKCLSCREDGNPERYIRRATEELRKKTAARLDKRHIKASDFVNEIESITDGSGNVKSYAYKLVIYDFFSECAEMDIDDMHDIFELNENVDENDNKN